MSLYVPQTYMYVSIVHSCSPTHWAPVRGSNDKSSVKEELSVGWQGPCGEESEHPYALPLVPPPPPVQVAGW